MTGRHGAGKDQLYGSSLLLSPISFEDRAGAVASIIGNPCKFALYVTIKDVKSRNVFVRQACTSGVQQVCQRLLRTLQLFMNLRCQRSQRRLIVDQRCLFQRSQHIGQRAKAQ